CSSDLKTTPVKDKDGLGTGNGYTSAITAGTRANAIGYYTIDSNTKYVRVTISGSSAYVKEPFTLKNISVRSDSYAYELPAPTPDYPIEINSLNDFDVVSSVGKRNLFTKDLTSLSGDSDNGYKANMWAGTVVNNSNLIKMLKPSTTYNVSYKFRLDSLASGTTAFNQNAHGTILLYSGKTGYPTVNMGISGQDTISQANS